MLYFSVLWMLKYSIRWRPPMLGLRCSCQDCGAHAKIVVLMPRLRCSCQDCGAHAKIEVLMLRLRCSSHLNLGLSTAILARAPQTRHKHLNPNTATTSPKVIAYFRGMKWNFEPKLYSPARWYVLKIHFGKRIGRKYLTWSQQWLEQSAPLYMRLPPPTRLPNQTKKI